MNNQGRQTILLVEDEAIIAMNQTMQLKKYGYAVITVPDGQKAIDTVENEKNAIKLILMDIDLGDGMDGTETARLILNEHDIPILFLSGHIEQDIVEKTENITSYGYVVKNSGITVLDASIKMAFKLHDAYRNLNIQKVEVDKGKMLLQFSEKRYRRLFESAKDGILILDAYDGKIVDVNPFLIEMLGYSKDEFLDKSIWEISAFKNIGYSKELLEELQVKKYIRYEDLPLETFDGKLIHVEFVSNVYIVDSERVIQCNIRDITDRRLYEDSLTADIEKTEGLLRELQHRTKNSFNLITSLISLKAGATHCEETRDALEELTLRVQSISDLYSLLYRTNSFYEVELKTYCDIVIESMFNFATDVAFDRDIEKISIAPNNAARIGMILVELLTNSIKYAFPERTQKTIRVEIRKSDSKLKLVVSDDGVGMPPGFDIGKASSMGLHLVDLMVTQLHGTIGIESKNGTKISIELAI